jgi:hypothetical protein
MAVEGVGEIYRVDRVEDLVIGGERYRLEVLRCTQATGMDPDRVEREPFSVRAYKWLEVELQPSETPKPAPVRGRVWVEFPLNNVHDHGQEDRALLEAHRTLLEEVKRRRNAK